MAEPTQGLRRSGRERKKAYKPSELSTIANKLLQEGWDSFDAKVGQGGDGEEHCTVLLYWRLPGGKSGNQKGVTGSGYGHAEMHAVHAFFETCQKNVKTFLSAELALQCESKPCCARCSAVLGLLGIPAYDDKTLKTAKSMGSTQWAVSDLVRKLLEGVTGAPADVFRELGSLIL